MSLLLLFEWRLVFTYSSLSLLVSFSDELLGFEPRKQNSNNMRITTKTLAVTPITILNLWLFEYTNLRQKGSCKGDEHTRHDFEPTIGWYCSAGHMVQNVSSPRLYVFRSQAPHIYVSSYDTQSRVDKLSIWVLQSLLLSLLPLTKLECFVSLLIECYRPSPWMCDILSYVDYRRFFMRRWINSKEFCFCYCSEFFISVGFYVLYYFLVHSSFV